MSLIPIRKDAVKTLDDLPLTEELVEGLDKLVPHRCPAVSQSEREIWMYAGKRALVDALMVACKRQKEKPLL